MKLISKLWMVATAALFLSACSADISDSQKIKKDATEQEQVGGAESFSSVMILEFEKNLSSLTLADAGSLLSVEQMSSLVNAAKSAIAAQNLGASNEAGKIIPVVQDASLAKAGEIAKNQEQFSQLAAKISDSVVPLLKGRLEKIDVAVPNEDLATIQKLMNELVEKVMTVIDERKMDENQVKSTVDSISKIILDKIPALGLKQENVKPLIDSVSAQVILSISKMKNVDPSQVRTLLSSVSSIVNKLCNEQSLVVPDFQSIFAQKKSGIDPSLINGLIRKDGP